jgi:signal peptidase
MAKKGQHAWLMENAPGTERERLLALREETLSCRQPRARRKRRELTPMQKLLHIGFSVVFWLVSAGLIAIMFTAFQSKREGDIPVVFGFSVLRVQTGSMVPTLPIGSIVVVRAPDDPAAIPEGTIATFRRSDGMIVTHRIIGVSTAEDGTVQYETKGDNPENAPDADLLTPDRVIGTFLLKITLPNIWGGN